MSTVEQIETAIETLSDEDYAKLRNWFTEKDWNLWDKKLEKDSDSGRLDFLVTEAFDAKAKGRLKDL